MSEVRREKDHDEEGNVLGVLLVLVEGDESICDLLH